MENAEKSRLNCEMIWRIWEKSRLNCEIIWKIWKKSKLNSKKNMEIIEEMQVEQ